MARTQLRHQYCQWKIPGLSVDQKYIQLHVLQDCHIQEFGCEYPGQPQGIEKSCTQGDPRPTHNAKVRLGLYSNELISLSLTTEIKQTAHDGLRPLFALRIVPFQFPVWVSRRE